MSVRRIVGGFDQERLCPFRWWRVVRGLSKGQTTAVRVGGLVCVGLVVAYVVHALTGVGVLSTTNETVKLLSLIASPL